MTDNELHAIENGDPGRPIRPHRSGGGINLGTIGHVDHGKMTLAAAVAMAMGMEHRYIGSVFGGRPLRTYPRSPGSEVRVTDLKTEHDHARIAKAAERRARRNAKRLTIRTRSVKP